jgi:hypothetical protein
VRSFFTGRRSGSWRKLPSRRGYETIRAFGEMVKVLLQHGSIFHLTSGNIFDVVRGIRPLSTGEMVYLQGSEACQDLRQTFERQAFAAA